MKYFILVFHLIFSAHVFSATPVTHIFLAEKWIDILNENFDEEQKALFMAGNLFPDIQYLGEISREDTHEENLTLEDVYLSSSSFLKGTRLHAYIDEKREAFVVEWHIYPSIENFSQGYSSTLLKLVEDEILYDRVQVQLIQNFLAKISEEETARGITYQTLQKWHQFLTQYFSLRPSQMLEHLAKQNKPFLNIPSETVKLWSHILPLLAKKENILDYVERLEKAFDQDFQSFKQSKINN